MDVLPLGQHLSEAAALCALGELHLLGSSRKEPGQEKVCRVCSADRAKLLAVCTGSIQSSHLEFYVFVIWHTVHAALSTCSQGRTELGLCWLSPATMIEVLWWVKKKQNPKTKKPFPLQEPRELFISSARQESWQLKC